MVSMEHWIRKLSITAALLGAAGASAARAQEDHVIAGTCLVFADVEADEGNTDVRRACPFDTPSGSQTLEFMVHIENPATYSAHVAAALDQTWVNIYYNGQLESFNPRVKFHLGCAPAGDDGSSAEDSPTDEISLADGYTPNAHGVWTSDFRCPPDRPQLRAVYLDTIASW